MKRLAIAVLAALFATATIALPMVNSSPAEAKGKAGAKKKAVAKKAPKKKVAKASRKKAAGKKSCGTFMYKKGSKCMDARSKK